LLQQRKAEQRLFERVVGYAQAPLGPAAFDLADPLEHHRVVTAVRPAMQRQADAQGRAFGARKQQAVAAKVVEADPIAPQAFPQECKAAGRQQLPRQQVMTLHGGLVTRVGRPVYDAKSQPAARRARLGHPRWSP